MNERTGRVSSDGGSLQNEVEDRFGVLPNAARPGVSDPEVLAHLWGVAKFGYVDNPLPSLFKERLFVYLSRFCEARTCIARHVGFLIGAGRPAGDSGCPPETVEQALDLINRPMPRGDDLRPYVDRLKSLDSPLASIPESDDPNEAAIFACATHVFLQTAQAPVCLEALRQAFKNATLQHLLVFLAYVRTAHFWYNTHPELGCDEDIQRLLAAHKGLAERVFDDSEAKAADFSGKLLDELTALRRSEGHRAKQLVDARFLASIVESSEDAIISKTLDGVIQTWNAAATRLFGYKAEQVIGRSITILIPVDRLSEEDHILSHIRVGERIESFDTMRLRDDGRLVPVSVTISPIKDEQGQVIGASKTARDISTRAQSERRLRESEEFNRSLMDGSADCVKVLDIDGRLLHMNAPGLCAMEIEDFGPFCGRDWSGMWPQEIQTIVNEAVASARRGEANSFQAFCPTAKGSPRWWDVTVSPVRDAEGGPVARLLSVSRDITDRKNAEIEAQKRSRQVRRLAEVAARLASVHDVASILGVVVEEARELIGAHEAVVVLTSNEDRDQVVSAVSTTNKRRRGRESEGKPDVSWLCSLIRRANKPLRMTQAELEAHPEREILGFEGGEPPRGWLGVPIIGSRGQNKGVLQLLDKFESEFTEDDESIAAQLAQMAAVAVDNARLVENLREADQKKDEFLSVLAHELRNPLAPIRTGLQVMKLAAADPQAIEKARSMMERQLGQMIHLIDDLMDLTRISQGKITLQKTRMPLSLAIQNAIDTSRPLIEQAGHDLTVDVPGEPILVDGDETRLSQVFANLLNNAAKYTDRGGRIRISAERRGDEAVIAVEDNGVGIPAAMLPKVFEIFTQVDRSLEKAQGGLGIGLSIVKRLVEMHGGSIEARSEGQGRGSLFLVHLPAVCPSPVGLVHASSGDQAEISSRRRVLVVDDNRDGAASLAMMLQVLGNETCTAFDGLEALDAAAEFQPDVILMDIGMPKLNGYETCRRLREQPWGRSPVIVACTGWGQEEDKRKSREAGFDLHMTKPVDPAALQKLLVGVEAK